MLFVSISTIISFVIVIANWPIYLLLACKFYGQCTQIIQTWELSAIKQIRPDVPLEHRALPPDLNWVILPFDVWWCGRTKWLEMWNTCCFIRNKNEKKYNWCIGLCFFKYCLFFLSRSRQMAQREKNAYKQRSQL